VCLEQVVTDEECRGDEADGGSFVIAPWVGRLRNGTLNYHDVEHTFPLNSGPHAVHGTVTGRP